MLCFSWTFFLKPCYIQNVVVMRSGCKFVTGCIAKSTVIKMHVGSKQALSAQINIRVHVNTADVNT